MIMIIQGIHGSLDIVIIFGEHLIERSRNSGVYGATRSIVLGNGPAAVFESHSVWPIIKRKGMDFCFRSRTSITSAQVKSICATLQEIYPDKIRTLILEMRERNRT